MHPVRADEGPFLSIPRMMARTPLPVYASVVLPVVVLLAAAALQPWLPPSDLMRDSQVIAARHHAVSPAYGLVSNLGIVVLALSSGAAVTARLVLREARAPWPRLLLWMAVVSLALVLDDLLLLHEAATFASWIGAVVAAAYGFAFLRFVLEFRTLIVRDLEVGLLALAVGSFGVSAATDLLVAATQASVLVEDGAKLLGLVAWSAFVLRTALAAFRHSGASTGAAPASPRMTVADTASGATIVRDSSAQVKNR